MNLIIILIWILIVSCFSLFGSWYAKKHKTAEGLIGLYVAIVIISNIIAFKIAAYDLGFVTLFATSASLIFPVTFLITDIVNEKFGRKETQKMIFIALIAQVAVAIFIYLAISLEAAPFWSQQESFKQVLGFAPRVMLASWIAYFMSENMDAYIFSWFKKVTRGKKLWMRNAFSSLPAMVVDTVVFVGIAFIGVQPLLPLIIGVLAIKWIVGIINIPFMYVNRWIIYKK